MLENAIDDILPDGILDDADSSVEVADFNHDGVPESLGITLDVGPFITTLTVTGTTSLTVGDDIVFV